MWGLIFTSIETATAGDFIFEAIEAGNIAVLSFLLSQARLDVNYKKHLTDQRKSERSRISDHTGSEISPLVYARQMLQQAREKQDTQAVARYEKIIGILKKHGALEIIPKLERDNDIGFFGEILGTEKDETE